MLSKFIRNIDVFDHFYDVNKIYLMMNIYQGKVSAKYIVYIFFMLNSCDKCGGDVNPLVDQPKIPQPEIEDHPIAISQSAEEKISDTITCTTLNYKWAPGIPEPILNDPTSDVIYLGSVLKAESIIDGSYTEIVGPRKPITISTSDAYAKLKSETISEPSLSSVRNAIGKILEEDSKGVTSANITLDVKEVYSFDHLKLEIGGHYGGFWGSVASNFSFNKTEIKSHYLLNFTQVYYSLDVNSLGPDDFFYEPEKISSIGKYSPVYISSIKYGRRVLMTIETKSISSGLDASLEAEFKALFGSGGINVSANIKKLLSDQSIKALVVGGSAASAIKVVTNSNELFHYFEDGANYSRNSPGLPLSYKLKYTVDNSSAAVVLSSEYSVRECSVIQGNLFDFEPKNITNWCPLHIGGDKDFRGHGPNFIIKVTIRIGNPPDQNKVFCDLYFKVWEKGPDHTTGERDLKNILLGSVSKDYKISSLNSKTYHEINGEDPDGTMITVFDDKNTSFFRSGTNLDSNSIVERIEFQGDTKGNDLGACTIDDSHISIYFRKTKVSARKL